MLPEWVKRDLLYIIVILFALLACFYTIYIQGDCQEKCNDRWEKQLEDSNCFLGSYSNDFKGGFINGIEDKDQNT